MIELLWNAPVSEERMRVYLDAVGAAAGGRVLDIGCGCGEALIRLCQATGSSGLGIDLSTDHIAEATRRAERCGVGDRVRFVAEDVASSSFRDAPYDAALCLGASHAFESGPSAYATAVSQLASLLKPGGKLLIAEGYLKRPAPPEYRRLLGESVPDEMTHASNVAVGVDAGLTPLGAWTSSPAEWDDFEWGYQRHVERAAMARPDDDAVQDRLSRRRAWMDAYLRWGRETLGYGTYLFQTRCA